jgi:hypothetical protein
MSTAYEEEDGSSCESMSMGYAKNRPNGIVNDWGVIVNDWGVIVKLLSNNYNKYAQSWIE